MPIPGQYYNYPPPPPMPNVYPPVNGYVKSLSPYQSPYRSPYRASPGR